MNTYILKSSKVSGVIKLTFLNGVLTALNFDLNAPLSLTQFAALVNRLPYNEALLNQFDGLGFSISKQPSTNETISLFCRLYEHNKGVKYKVSAADAGKIRNITLTEDILKHYFASTSFIFKDKHSISNVVRYYNELLAEIAALNKPKHPNSYNKEYETKLQTSELPAYWAHLRGLGLNPKKDRVGNTIGWE